MAEVRARFLHEWLDNMEHEPTRLRLRFFAALPGDVRSTIEGAPRTSWLPMDLHVLLADITGAALGPASSYDYYRRSVSKSFRGPVLGPMLRTGTRLLGLTPATCLRWASHGWDAVFRDCGVVHGEVSAPGRGRMIYASLPAVCVASAAWIDSAQGSAYGLLDSSSGRPASHASTRAGSRSECSSSTSSGPSANDGWRRGVTSSGDGTWRRVEGVTRDP